MLWCLLKQHVSAHVCHLRTKINVKQMQFTLLSVATVVLVCVFITLLNYVLKFLCKNLVKVRGDVLVYTPGVTEYIQVSQEEGTKLRESVPYVKIYRYNPKHLYPKLNGYGDNGQRSLKL